MWEQSTEEENIFCNVHVPVANSLRNIGLSNGKASITDWAGPNIASISTMVIAPKWELKFTSIESSLPPAPRKIKPKITLKKIVMPNRAESDVVSLATFNNSLKD